MQPDRKIRLGGLWKNQTKSGETYYSGGLGPNLRLLVFKNNFKENDKDPDLVLYLAPAEQGGKDQRPGAQAEPPSSGLDELEFPA